MVQGIENNKHLLKGRARAFLDTNEQVRNLGTCSPSDGVSVQTLSPKVGRMVYKHNLISPLLDYANKVQSPNIPEYIAVLRCGKELDQSENKYLKQRSYCGSRLCPICSNIRSRKVADVVLATIDMNKEWCSLTLTKSNNGLEYNLDKLQERLDSEQKWFNKVRDRYRKQGGDFSAIISLEVVPPGYKYKGKSRYYADYHPHYHILCTKEFAYYLKKSWLDECKDDADEKNQVIKIVGESLKKDESLTIALMKTIREVVKYSLKACLPKDKNDSEKSRGSFSINVKGTDELVTMMKGRKRFKKWGCFLKKAKEIQEIENSLIQELDLEKVAYSDLPVQDTGELVNMVDYNNNIICCVPSYKKTIVWVYDYKRQNYYYIDEWGKEYELIKNWSIKKYKIFVFEGEKLIRTIV
jgi:hypothetical protein